MSISAIEAMGQGSWSFGISEIISGLGVILTGIEVAFTISDARRGAEKSHLGRNLAIIFATVICLGLAITIVIGFKPLEVSATYQDGIAVVKLEGGPAVFGKNYYRVGDGKPTPYEKEFGVCHNTTIHVYARFLFLNIAEKTLTIDTYPEYEVTLGEYGKLTVKIDAPKDITRLEDVLLVDRNGSIDLVAAAACGVGGTQYHFTGPDGAERDGCFAYEAFPPSGGGCVRDRKAPLDQGYLTIHAPLSNGNGLDITLSKKELQGLLERNSYVELDASFSEKVLQLSMRSPVNAACQLKNGILVELYGPGRSPASVALREDGSIVKTSVARKHGASVLSGAFTQAPTEDNPPFNEREPYLEQEQPVVPLSQEDAAAYSMIIPLPLFEGKSVLRIEDEMYGRMFADVSMVDADAVGFAASHKLLIGWGPDLFAPDEAVTYDMVMTVLFRLTHDAESTVGGDSEAWYAESRYWALENGLVPPDADGEFSRGPEIITQMQCLRILWRYDYEGLPDAVVSDDQIRSWAIDGKIISADASNPSWPVSRVQLARFIMNYCIAAADRTKAVNME